MWNLYNNNHKTHLEKLRQVDEEGNHHDIILQLTGKSYRCTLPSDDDSDGDDDGANFDAPNTPQERLSRSASMVSTTSTHSTVFGATEALTKALWERAKESSESHAKDPLELKDIRTRFAATLDAAMRTKVGNHAAQPPVTRQQMADRGARNGWACYPGPQALTPHSPTTEGPSSYPLTDLLPFLTPAEHLRILKAREKALSIRMLRDTWEAVRPSIRHWYALKDSSFHGEARRTREMLDDPEMQLSSDLCRHMLMDLYRREYLEKKALYR